MKVIVKKAKYDSMWYANKIGKVFEVESQKRKIGLLQYEVYYLHNSIKFIHVCDCKKVKADSIEAFPCHYSGERSRKFWNMVNNLSTDADRQQMYSLGVALQNMEEYVVSQLSIALENKNRIKKQKQ